MMSVLGVFLHVVGRQCFTADIFGREITHEPGFKDGGMKLLSDSMRVGSEVCVSDIAGGSGKWSVELRG